MAPRARKAATAAPAPALEVPAELPPAPLVPQPHGGALRRGNPGNRGGFRHPSQVRELARAAVGRRLELLEQFADGYQVAWVPQRVKTGENKGREKVDPATGQTLYEWAIRPVPVSERRAALDTLARIGMGPAIRADDVAKRLEAQVDVLRQMLPPDLAHQVLARLADVWK